MSRSYALYKIMSSSSRRPSLQDHRHRHHHSPSFSSTLLEEIYRSFDEESENHHLTNADIYRMKKTSTSTYFDTEDRFVLDRWIDNDNVKVRRASLPEGIFRRNDHRRPANYYSSTSSSDSCSSGTCGFSSYDTESLCRSSRQNPLPPLKLIRTVVNPAEIRSKNYSDEVPPAKKNKKEGNLHRRALKLYGDLKKVKQPISPGGKLAAFLNSLFNSNALKKPKISSSSPSSNGINLERESASAPSTASRSCLSKTPSSTGRFEKRSVRFVDEERGHIIRNGTSADVAKRESPILANDEEFKHQLRENHRRVEAAKELLKNYHLKNRKESTADIASDHHDLRKFGFQCDEERESEDDDDDLSCCSSDLFELENWLEIGVDHRYREELPVYETTRFDPNRAIAI
ncbi:hypothetical protein Cgig2_025169 [Carnegiea gigantea]|uniref:Protein BIG GRAIN 1-like A n=1 Tax=Carnegiea gigantea TaxID=171969 RepID=A0A9Q1QQ49_9CARY|nr:hypothetical protein Cgig2_025169 [Carnegiea gigantea]